MPTDIQFSTLARLRADVHVDNFTWHDEFDTPHFIVGQLTPESEAEVDEIVIAFLNRYGDLYAISDQDNIFVSNIKSDERGNRYVRVGREVWGRRVYPSVMNFWVNPFGVIVRVKAHWPIVKPIEEQRPAISIGEASSVAARYREGAKLIGIVGEPRLEYYLTGRKKSWTLALAWNLIARFEGKGPSTEGFVIDAAKGSLIRRYPDEDEVATTATGTGINNVNESATSPSRTVQVDDPGGSAELRLLDTTRSVTIETRDMAGATAASATAYSICEDDDSDGQFTNITNSPRNDSDRPEVDAHYNTGLIHDYFHRAVNVGVNTLFGRDGWDDNTAQKWVSAVHRDTNSISSFFSRSAKVTMHGDGDGPVGTSKMTYKPTLDTCAHEWAHAVQSSEIAGTNPNGGFDGTAGENFVLQEASADMWAGAINRDGGWRFGAVFEDDASLLLAGATHTSTGFRLRGFRRPSDFGQPDHYYAAADTSGLGFAGTTQDYTRIGILDKAAYLIAAGGRHPSPGTTTYPPIDVYGIGVTCFENILYYTLVNWTVGSDVFLDFRADMIAAAQALYPGDPCKAHAVERAFDAVGIYASASDTTPPARPSGPDPMITPWGARTDNPPYWQSPDIYVRDAGGAIADPLKGQVNRLFANVHNIGDAGAIDVQVSFAFSPYNMGGSYAEKAIDTKTVTIPAGGSLEVEVAWDLTDLTDTNGGLWPLPLSDFDHFCVRISLQLVGDVDTCNNRAQNNFGNVGTADGGDGTEVLLLGNPMQKAAWVALILDHRISRSWKAEVDVGRRARDEFKTLVKLMDDQHPTLPWIGSTDNALLIPLAPGELRPVKLRWSIDTTKTYEGRVYGMLCGEVSGYKATAGPAMGEVHRLRLDGTRFSATVTATVQPVEGPAVSLRGDIEGKVDRKSGKFEGIFVGIGSHKGKESNVKTKVAGLMAATASFSLVSVMAEGEQGIDLAVPLVADLSTVQEKCRRQLRKYRS